MIIAKYPRRLVLLSLSSLITLTSNEASESLARQSADPYFNSRVARPAYLKQHPKVLFDEMHNNADTAGGRYKPFADLIESDGYRIAPSSQSFSKGALKGYDVLVIVNASGPGSQRD